MFFIRKIQKMRLGLFYVFILCIIGMKYLKNAIPDFGRIKVVTEFDELFHHLFYHNVFIASKDRLEEINNYIHSKSFTQIDFTKYFTKSNSESFGILYRDITGLIKVF
jgi:hypothetical protein